MTFTDKKIEEFRDKFQNEQGDIVNENCRVYTMTKIENWLKEKLAEAEKEGMKKAYEEYVQEYSTYDSDITWADVFNFTKKKLKEL